mgnify:CR=1 FL=1
MSIIIAASYTICKIPSYLGICVQRTILSPTDYEIEAVEKAMEISFPKGTEVNRITCLYTWQDPEMFSFGLHIKLPQTDEGQQFIQLYNTCEKMQQEVVPTNEKSFEEDGSFKMEFITQKIHDIYLLGTLKKMSQPLKPILGTLWMIAILLIILYRLVNKRYKRKHIS